MNSIGRIFRVSVFGESHGPKVGALVDGVRPGLAICEGDFEPDMGRRRARERGTTERRERDAVEISSGVFEGRATGAPVLLEIVNGDVDSSSYADRRSIPRPGHADLPARLRYGGFADHRGGGHFSGRLSAGLVAAGVIARRMISPARVRARLVSVGGSEDAEARVNAALERGDSVGGVVECVVSGVPAGIGEPFFDSLESRLAHAAFSIPGIKGIEFGAGFAAAAMAGSELNDPILSADGRTATNHSGGINGGLSNGNDVVFRIAVRPTASVAAPQRSVNLDTGAPEIVRVAGRHDACFALRVPVILESVAAIVLADSMAIARALTPADP